jgi:hypothetical protein
MVMAALAGAPAAAVAQATGMPSFNAPYRAFARHEFGAAVSFANFDAGTGLEGEYRFASGQFDVGLRGGVLLPDAGDTEALVGVEARLRVITHSVDFPLDGAFIFGGGFNINGGTDVILPAALSLGRRLEVENSNVSIIPYVQPTALIVNAEVPTLTGTRRDTDLLFALGVGADFRLSPRFDARVSLGLGDLEGISLAAVWIR